MGVGYPRIWLEWDGHDARLGTNPILRLLE
jgi:hypothetical protein